MSLPVPLVRRDGSIRAVALVDDEDHDWLSMLSWSWHHGYAVRTIRENGRQLSLYMHRLILDVVDAPTSVDHINRNKLDNRRANLRTCTQAENLQNQSGKNEYRGVGWHKASGKWRAYSRMPGEKKTVHLGLYTDQLEAARVAVQFRREHMPFAVEALA